MLTTTISWSKLIKSPMSPMATLPSWCALESVTKDRARKKYRT